jgi:hypothetical protein
LSNSNASNSANKMLAPQLPPWQQQLQPQEPLQQSQQ